MPGPADAQKAVEEFARLLAAQDARASASVIRAYAPVYRQLQKDTRAVVSLAKDLSLTEAQVAKRIRNLERQFLANASKFADTAGKTVTASQRAAVGLARRGAEQAVVAGLPPGIRMDNLARLGMQWNRLPDEAFTNFIGIAADGHPVGNLLAPLGPEAAQGVKDAIGTSIALGKSPSATAELVRAAAGMPLSKALLITRTETNRAFREASRLQYADNSDIVKGYRRLADHSDRTCMACIALDGILYGLDKPLNEHPNGRCSLVPETLTYQDLGLDVEMPPEPENAEGWLRRQPEDTQRKILGDVRYEAIQRGELQFDQLVTVRSNAVWGDSAVVRPLKDLGLVGVKPKAPPKVVPSRFTNTAYRLSNMKGATSVSGADKAALSLSGTSSGQELAGAVKMWARGGNPDMRVGAQMWTEGKEIFESGAKGRMNQAGASIGEAASVAPPINKRLYRGIHIEDKGIDEMEKAYPTGKVYDTHVSSYSTRENVAREFAGSATNPESRTAIIFDLEPGARGLNIEPISLYTKEKERIISGRYEVMGTQRKVERSGPFRIEGTTLHVKIRQIQPLVKKELP